MSPAVPLLVVAFAAPAATLPTEVWQVAPDAVGRSWVAPTKPRAALLVHGLKIHPLRPERATRPERHEWQDPDGALAKALAKDFDVYAFGYAQTVPVDTVPHTPGMREAVARLRQAGYRELVLIGHSAGGVIVRLFAENYPDSGITKVIQTAAPNAGSDLATIKAGYHKVQAPFIQSLAPAPRMEASRTAKKLISPRIEFVSVVCKIKRVETDGLVNILSQWPADLQSQGLPAALLGVPHWDAPRVEAGAKRIAELARERLTRWTPEQVEVARRILFRETDEIKK